MTDDAPITAYHGSPHDFEQFDTSKIGTGEGAQAYGHGLYFAESEPIAKEYRDRLTDRTSLFRVGNIDMPKWILRGIENAPDRNAAIEKHRQDFLKRLDEDTKDQETSAQPWMSAARISSHKDILAGLDQLQSGSNLPHTKGRMYEVAIDAHPDHFLDWDKPISGQSEHAQNAVSNLVADRYLHPTFRNELADLVDRGWFTGEKLHEKLTAKHGLPMAAGLLDKHGLHGIKYFDAGSRGSNEQQTRNYVVFDHNRVKVRRKYEQGGAVAKSPAKLHNPAIVEHVLTKVSAPPPALNPSPVASGDARSKPSGETYV